MPDLENTLDASQFRLNCTPVVNLFPRSLDRVHVSAHQTELHVVPELSRPMDFEIYSLDRVLAIGSGGESLTEVLPFYSTRHRDGMQETRTYYTVQRRPRLASARQRRTGVRTNYLGSEFFMTIVDSHDRDITGEISQLEVQAHCTNRDLRSGSASARRASTSHSKVERQSRPSAASGPAAEAFDVRRYRVEVDRPAVAQLPVVDRHRPDRGAEGLRQLLGLYADRTTRCAPPDRRRSKYRESRRRASRSQWRADHVWTWPRAQAAAGRRRFRGRGHLRLAAGAFFAASR